MATKKAPKVAKVAKPAIDFGLIEIVQAALIDAAGTLITANAPHSAKRVQSIADLFGKQLANHAKRAEAKNERVKKNAANKIEKLAAQIAAMKAAGVDIAALQDAIGIGKLGK